MGNIRIRRGEFLNQNSLFGLDLEKDFFAPGPKIVLQHYRGQTGLTWKWRWSILRPNDCELVTVPVDELMAQYSSASMMVMTRSVMDGSDGSRE
jgi:hypothetical protein